VGHTNQVELGVKAAKYRIPIEIKVLYIAMNNLIRSLSAEAKTTILLIQEQKMLKNLLSMAGM
jgi:hypothetical protein